MKNILSHPEIKAYVEKMKKSGRCEQCQYPWNDGLCECKTVPSDEDIKEAMRITVLSFSLEKEGWKFKF